MYELTLRQRFWAIRVAGVLCAALSLQSCASADDETAKGIAAAKAKQLEAARQQARAPFSAGEIATREVRPTTLRDSGPAPALCAPAPGNAASRIWIQSGDLKLYNVLVTNSRGLVTDSSTRGPLRFDLYHYREAAARGITRMDADGTLRVDLAPMPAMQ